MTTNSQLKYRRAIEWCDAHKSKLPRYCKYRLMSSSNLYGMLDVFGVRWLADYKLWSDFDSKEGADVVKGVSAVGPQNSASGHTLIRIIAHRALIGKRVAELIELCEALNWNVLKISNPVGEEGVEFWRVYITVVVNESGD